MLPAPHRMRRGHDFDVAVKRGRRSGRRTVVVHAGVASTCTAEAGTALPVATVGFVVSKAVGPAVVRTRVKRRLRALLAHRIDLIPPGTLVVVRANPAAARATSSALAADLD